MSNKFSHILKMTMLGVVVILAGGAIGAQPQDDLSNLRVKEISASEIEVTIDYRYGSDHGATAQLSAVPLSLGSELPFFSSTSVTVAKGSGTATAKISYDKNNPPERLTTDQIRVFLQDQGGTRFFVKDFDYTKNWQLVQPPVLQVNPGSLSFSGQVGQPDPAPQTFRITNAGGGTLSWTATTNVGWVSLSQTRGDLSARASESVAVSVRVAGLSAGTHRAQITITAPGARGSPATVAVSLTLQPAPPRTLRVPQDFPTIRAAINAARDGDRILVAPGTYRENLIIHKSLTLEGAGKEVTVIDSQVDPPGSTITIAGASDVVIKGFKITGSGRGGQTGIFIPDSQRVTITDNLIDGNAAGITTHARIEIRIIDNEITNSQLGVGISLGQATKGLIFRNVIRGNAGSGIELWENSAAEITENVIQNNRICGVFVDPESTVTGRNNTISGNGTDLCPPDYPWPPGFRK